MHQVSEGESLGVDGTHHCVLSYHDSSRLDVAYVSTDLWRDLTFFLGQGEQDRIAVSITPFTNTFPGPHIDSRVNYTFWVSPPVEASIVPSSGISISSAFRERLLLKSSETQSQCIVTRVTPLPLQAVFVSTHDPAVYRLVQEHSDIIYRRLCEDNQILRTGDLLYLEEPPILADSEKRPLIALNVAMTEPVLQGYVQRDRTRFLVTLGSPISTDFPNLDAVALHSDEQLLSRSSDDFTIDESFLASSTLNDLLPPQARYAQTSIINNAEQQVANGKATSSWMASTLSLKMLAHIIDEKFDETCTAFVHTDVLGKIGLFEGDWAVIEIGVERGTKPRLVQIRSSEHLPSNDCLYASPVFIRNCGYKLGNATMPVQIAPISINPLHVPTAGCVTISRVASPSISDRAGQNLQFNAVKHFFMQHRRLIKKDDLIAIPLVAEIGSLSKGFDSEEGTPISIEDFFSGIANIDYRPNAIAFFLVTEMDIDAATIRKSHNNKDAMSIGCNVGEFGCWLDSSSTKVIQSGVEHSDVPDLEMYIDSPSMPLPPQKEPLDSTAYCRLDEVLRASSKDKVDFGYPFAVLVTGSSELNMRTAVHRIGGRLGFHIFDISTYDIIDETDAKTASRMKDYLNTACTASPCILFVEDIDALLQTTQPLEPGKESNGARIFKKCLNDLYDDCKESGHKLIVVASAESVDRLPPLISSCFKEQITFEAPNECERHSLLTSLTASDRLGPDVSLRILATQTAALAVADLLDLVQRARHQAIRRVFSSIHGTKYSSRDVVQAGIMIMGVDFEEALADSRSSYSQSIGAPSIPSVAWEDVGGLVSVKEDILDTIQLPLDHPELFSEGLKQRSGILLYGPPGTGKTLLAKAVATSCSLNFLSVKGPELLNMYIGESEANVRRIFQRARDAKPCVIFFDELDSIAPKRGNHGDSGGVMDRIVSQILAELDGMSASSQGADVFVIGATNRPDLLDPALLRPGRFDRMLYLGISETHDAQLNILEALTRKFRLHPDLRLISIAELCPFNYTGADFYALCSDAMLKAMARKAEEVQSKIDRMNLEPPRLHHQHPITPQYYLSEMATPSDIDVLVTQEDFLQALKDLVPSVSMAELIHYKEVQVRFTQK